MASFGNYLKNNLFGHWNAGTWNVLPAVLTTWSNLLANSGNKTMYSLYKDQAQNYIDAAKDNAALIKSQGEIALRNLQYKNKLLRGDDVVRVAASGMNMSGSHLDLLVRKDKIRKMNECALNANYANQAMMELSNGYSKAANAYGSLAIKAGNDKYSALAAILKGVETYVDLSVRDAKVESQVKQGFKQVNDMEATQTEDQAFRYKGVWGKTAVDGPVKRSRLMSGGYSTDNENILLNSTNNLIDNNSILDDNIPFV